MSQVDLAEFVNDCSNLRSFFKKVKRTGKDAVMIPLAAEKPEYGHETRLKVLGAKDDFMLVQKSGSECLGGNIGGTLVLPYAGSVGYAVFERE